MATYYLRSASGSCGSTYNGSLSTSIGASDTSQDVEGVVTQDEDVWDLVVGAVTYRAGTWYANIDVTVGTGGGTDNKIRVFIDRRDSSCVRQENIFDQTSGVLTQGATTNLILTQYSSIERAFGATDKLSVSIVDAGGSDTKNIQFEGAGANFDSNIVSPRTGDRRIFVVT